MCRRTMDGKVTITFDNSGSKDVKKTFSVDSLSNVEQNGDRLFVEFYNNNETLEVNYCKAIEFHN